MHLRRRQLYTIILIEAVLICIISVLLLVQLQKPPVKSKENGIFLTPTATHTPTPTPTPTPSAIYPAQVLDLTNWKITLPIGSDEDPLEIKQPQLATYRLDPWFVVISDTAVRFRAPVKSVTTTGSNYPRSELREMTKNGREKANWSTTLGTHTMMLDQAITAVPKTKKHLVAGQIHDADEDIIVIRLEFPRLYINVNGENVATLDDRYTLGKRFRIKFVVRNGKTHVFYNDSPTAAHTLTKDYTGAYFKAGAYTQSNCTREKDPALCTDDNYGEVLLYNLAVTHQ